MFNRGKIKKYIRIAGATVIVPISLGLAGCGSEEIVNTEIPVIEVDTEGKTEKEIRIARLDKIWLTTREEVSKTDKLNEKEEKMALKYAISAIESKEYEKSVEEHEKLLFAVDYLIFSDNENIKELGDIGKRYIGGLYRGMYENDIYGRNETKKKLDQVIEKVKVDQNMK